MKKPSPSPTSSFSAPSRFRIISEWEIPWTGDLGGRRWKTLFDEPRSSLQVVLEDHNRGSIFCRSTPRGWEEILAWRGSWYQHGIGYAGTYFLLTPGEEPDSWTATEEGCQMLRISYQVSLFTSSISQGKDTPSKSSIKPQQYDQLVWNEIPPRRPGDPGSRITELSRNSNATLITSLMDCRPGWILDEHQHPSDVISYCFSGGGILIGQQHEVQFSAGQMVVIPSGMPHAFRTGADGAFILAGVFPPFLLSA
jgi:quercetin dioxygenase-like cupin family protein